MLTALNSELKFNNKFLIDGWAASREANANSCQNKARPSCGHTSFSTYPTNITMLRQLASPLAMPPPMPVLWSENLIHLGLQRRWGMGTETNSTTTQDGPVCRKTSAQAHLVRLFVPGKLVLKLSQLPNLLTPTNQQNWDQRKQESLGTFSTLLDTAPASLVC